MEKCFPIKQSKENPKEWPTNTYKQFSIRGKLLIADTEGPFFCAILELITHSQM